MSQSVKTSHDDRSTNLVRRWSVQSITIVIAINGVDDAPQLKTFKYCAKNNNFCELK